MRIPVTEARRQLDTGAGTFRVAPVNTGAGRALEGLGKELGRLGERYQEQQEAALGERYQQQQDADQAMHARKNYLAFQSDVRADYEAALENAPENGAGLYESWIVGTEDEPGVFDKRALGFIAALPEALRGEYMARVDEMRDGYDYQLARDQLEISRSFANSVITQQMEASVAAISRNPGTFEDQLEDVTALVMESGLPVSQAAELLQASEQQLAMIAARAQMGQDPEGFGRALDDHQSRYGGRRIDAAFEAAEGGENDATVEPQPGDGNQGDVQNSERPTATRGTIRSRVDGAFEDAGQGEEGQEASGSPYDSILQRLEPSQIDDLRFELEDARFEEKRRADYNAAALRRALDDNLKSIRDTGWPAQEIDPREVKSLLGEEEAGKYETDRTVARSVYRAVQATAGLPEEELRPEVEAIVRRSGGDPSSAEAVAVETLQQRQRQQELQERDPVRWAMRHPDVQGALGADIWARPEDMERFIEASLTAQTVADIPEDARQPIPGMWAQWLGNNLRSTLARARQEGISEFDAMSVAVDSIRGRFGDRYAEQVTAAAIGALRDPGNLPVLARRVFATSHLAAGETVPFLVMGPVEPAVENFSRTFTRLSDTQRARFNTRESAAAIHLGADFRQGLTVLEDMPRRFDASTAWPPSDVASMSDSELSAPGERPSQEDPVRLVMNHPEVQAAQEGLDVSDRASVSALITSLESAQQNAGIAQADRRPISERWMWHLSNGLAGFLGVAESRGVDPYDAMRLSFDVFRDVVGQQEAGRVFLSALQSADAPPNRLARAQRVIANAEPFDANLAPGALITPEGLFGRFPGLESALRNGYDASFGERVRRTFRLAVGELDQMPRANGLAYGSEDAWPPFTILSENDEPSRFERFRRGTLNLASVTARSTFQDVANIGMTTAYLAPTVFNVLMDRPGYSPEVANVMSVISGLSTSDEDFGIEAFVSGLRLVPSMSSSELARLQNQVDDLENVDASTRSNIRVALEAVHTGALSVDDITMEGLFGVEAMHAQSAGVQVARRLYLWAEHTFPTQPGMDDHFTTHLGEALGQSVVDVAVVAATRGAGSGRLVAGLNVLAASGEQINSAMNDGATQQDILLAATLGGIVGLSGTIPFDMIVRIPVLRDAMSETMSKFAGGILDAGGSAFVETFAQNVVAIIQGDERDLLEGALPSTAAGITADQMLDFMNSLVRRYS